MTLSVKDIAAALGAEAFGAVDICVARLAEPRAAGPDDLALAMSPAWADSLLASAARAAIVWPGADWQALGLQAAIVVSRPRMAMAQMTQMFDSQPTAPGIHSTAVLDPTARIGNGCGIGPFSIIGADVQIGENCRIGAHVTLAPGARIGENCMLHDGVRVGRNVILGSRVILQPNVVVGADGFSFVTRTPSNEERAFATMGRTPLAPPEDAVRHRIHSLGSVIIGDDVEVGSNSTIDAGTIRPTRIGRGTKIDNLVQVGHNVIVGEDCVLCAQSAVAGSAVLGDRVVMGGKSGIKDNITVGNDVVLGGAAIVLTKVPDGRFMMGYPAVEMPVFRAREKALRRLQVSRDTPEKD